MILGDSCLRSQMKCIYCQKRSIDSKNQAHVVPEGILYNNVVLPLGAECDDCNNYASTLENSIIHHNRVWVPIMMGRVPGKNKKKRKQIGNISVDHRNNSFNLSANLEWISVKKGRHVVQCPNHPQFNNNKFRRGLYHIAFNYAAWKLGVSCVHLKKYDNIRKYVRYAKPNELWPYGQKMYPDMEIRKKLELHHVEEAPGYVVKLSIFIDDFYMEITKNQEFENWFTEKISGNTLFHKGT